MLSRNIQALTPSFLKKIDQYLLVNRPNLWATKIHHFAFWGSLYFLLLNAIAWFYPMAMNSVPCPETAFVVLLLTSIAFFLYWVYQLSLFKVEDKFGISSAKNRLQNRVIYALGILFLGVCPYYYTNVLNYRIEGLVSSKMIMQDLVNIKKLHSILARGEISSINSDFCNIEIPYVREENMEMPLASVPIPESSYREEIPEQYQVRMAEIVSEGLKSYNKYSSYYIQQDSHVLEFETYTIKEACENNIHTILEAQNNRPLFHEEYFNRFYIWFVLSFTLLLFIFLTVAPSTFIMAVVSAFVSMMGLIIVAQFLNAMMQGALNSNSLMFFMYLCLMGFCATLAYSSRNTKRFAIIRQIGLILLSTGLSFLPLITDFALFKSFGTGDNGGTIWLLVGITFALGMWNMVFAAKMRTLCADPQQN